ncbi:MAG: M55 family metallopeptidase, partial [Longimicrobiales bacterium]
GAVFIGYHAKAGHEGGFLAHTGSGSVKGLWVNGVEVGEGGMNALFAGSLGVPVILASGDQAFSDEFTELTGAPVVVTKDAIGSSAARLRSPERVLEELDRAAREAVVGLDAEAGGMSVTEPVVVRMRFATNTRAYILEAIPGVERIDGYTVEFPAETMAEAYELIRLAYRFIRW